MKQKGNAKEVELDPGLILVLACMKNAAELTQTNIAKQYVDSIFKLIDESVKEGEDAQLAQMIKANGALRGMCGIFDIQEKDVAKQAKITNSRVSWVNSQNPLESAKKTRVRIGNLQEVLTARRELLNQKFASARWVGVDADEYVRGVRDGDLKL